MLLAKRVTGEEEVPEGCVAVVTPDAPDVLSHVSVRARNMRVLFAICHEEQPLKDIEALNGKVCASPCCCHASSSHSRASGYRATGPIPLPRRQHTLVTCPISTYMSGKLSSRGVTCAQETRTNLPINFFWN